MATIEDTRAIVEAGETFEGKLVPTVRSEIDRPVTVHEDATVTGGIYGATVTVEEGATVEGSIMASDGVDLLGGEVQGGVGTPGRVEGADAHVAGTVTGSRVRLDDAVVRGNVVGTEVRLDGCAVLGMVVGDRTLRLRESVCYTFEFHGEGELADTDVVLPQAVVDGRLDLDTPVGVVGLGELDGVSGDGGGVSDGVEDGDGREGDDDGEDGDADRDDEDGRITLTREDVVEHDGSRYLTIADRVLNLEEVRDRVEELETQLRAAVVDGAGTDSLDLDRLGVDDLPAAEGVATVEGAALPGGDRGGGRATGTAEDGDSGGRDAGTGDDAVGTAARPADGDGLFEGLFPGGAGDGGEGDEPDAVDGEGGEGDESGSADDGDIFDGLFGGDGEE